MRMAGDHVNATRINKIIKSIKEDLKAMKEAEQDMHVMELISVPNVHEQKQDDPRQRIRELKHSIRQHVYQLKEEVES